MIYARLVSEADAEVDAGVSDKTVRGRLEVSVVVGCSESVVS